jgi:hypothetical protein
MGNVCTVYVLRKRANYALNWTARAVARFDALAGVGAPPVNAPALGRSARRV